MLTAGSGSESATQIINQLNDLIILKKLEKQQQQKQKQ
jgi:hypothetical protein